jgi:hypothetical protein
MLQHKVETPVRIFIGLVILQWLVGHCGMHCHENSVTCVVQYVGCWCCHVLVQWREEKNYMNKYFSSNLYLYPGPSNTMLSPHCVPLYTQVLVDLVSILKINSN